MSTRTWVARLLVLPVSLALGLAVPASAHADEIRDKQWHLKFLDIAKTHQISRGEGVTVAVLDTGVDYKHPDLKGALLEGRTFGGGRDDGWEDTDGHGTAMASLIAGRGHGVRNGDGVLGIAPAADVLPVRTGSGKPGDTRGLQLGLEWAADHGADILSISQGAIDIPDIEESVNYALEKGVVVVAGVGNTDKGDDEVMAPAVYPGVVAVSGTDQDGYFTDKSVSGPQVVLAAPATKVMSAGPKGGYDNGTGTSNSTAIVAGVAALIKSKYPELDAANVIQRLIATADDRGPEGRDEQYGFGVVDPVAALTEDVPGVDANPLITPSKPPAKPSRSHGTAGGLRPSSYAFIALGILGMIALVIIGLIAVVRRRRATQLPRGTATYGPVRPPLPPGSP